MGFFKSKPAREQAEEPNIICDLDAIKSSHIWFRFEGLPYKIRPITNGEYLSVQEKFFKMEALKQKEAVSPQEASDAYTDLILSLCDNIDRKTIERMEPPQTAAVCLLIFDMIRGRVRGESAEKKTLLKETKNLGSTLHS